ncbi:MAG: metallophosphoesterase [Lachnospiraceae bacterium]|nr:metallophosphoesterase [Lachnospiraceae bacterium]
MKLLIVHLSDLHIGSGKDSHSINLDKLVDAIQSVEKADKCVIIVSGDLAQKGVKKNYKYVKGFLIALKNMYIKSSMDGTIFIYLLRQEIMILIFQGFL